MENEHALTILLIEDEPAWCTLTKHLFESAGWTVLTAMDGQQALQILALDGARPDIVVTDMVMPVVDGFTFLRRYAERPSPRPPVLALCTVAEHLPAAVQTGADEAMEKPFDPDALIERVRQLARGGARLPPSAPAGIEETARLEAVSALRIEDIPYDIELNRFLERAARLFQVSTCVVSVVTREREHWVASWGLPSDLDTARSIPREASFGSLVVLSRDALVVQDTHHDPVLAPRALVREHGIRFYAAVPVFSRLGEALGALSLMDTTPRFFTHFDLALLQTLSRRVAAAFEMRERTERPGEPACSFRSEGYLDEDLRILGRQAFTDVLRVQSFRAAERREPLALLAAAVALHETRTVVQSLEARFDRALLGRLGESRLGVLVPGQNAERALITALEVIGHDARIDSVDVTPTGAMAEACLQRVEASLGTSGLSQRV